MEPFVLLMALKFSNLCENDSIVNKKDLLMHVNVYTCRTHCPCSECLEVTSSECK